MMQSSGLWPLLLVLAPMIKFGASSATCPLMIQSGGRRLLLLVQPRMFQSGASAATCPVHDPVQGRGLLFLDPSETIQSRASGRHRSPVAPVRGVIRHLSLDDPVRVAAAPAACSAPDDRVRGFRSLFSACCCRCTLAAPSCFDPDDPVRGTPWPRHRIAASPRSPPAPRFTASPQPPPLHCCIASPRPPPLGCCSASPRPYCAEIRAGRWGCLLVVNPPWFGRCLALPLVPWLCVCGARCPRLRHLAAVVALQLVPCRGCARRPASLACLLAPRWCAAPRLVRSLPVFWSAFPLPWCILPLQGLSPPDLLGGCARHVEAGREPGSRCLPLAPAEAGALSSLRVVPARGPAMGLSLAVPSVVDLRLRALRCFGVCGPSQ